MRRLLIFAGLALLLAGGLWWRHRPAHPAPVNASIYETDMVEHLVRELLTELKPPLPPVCFLAFGDGTTPPSRAFIARFAGAYPTVRGCSSAAMPPIGKYFETATGKPGIIIHIVRFQEIIPGNFEVWVTFSNRPPAHNELVYHVMNLGGVWKIEQRPPA